MAFISHCSSQSPWVMVEDMGQTRFVSSLSFLQFDIDDIIRQVQCLSLPRVTLRRICNWKRSQKYCKSEPRWNSGTYCTQKMTERSHDENRICFVHETFQIQDLPYVAPMTTFSGMFTCYLFFFLCLVPTTRQCNSTTNILGPLL